MNKLRLLITLLFFAMGSSAQKSNFGIVDYTVPAGYELVNNDNVLTYFKENKSTGAYCNFFVYKPMAGKGNTVQNFDWAWDNLMQKPFKFNSAANKQSEAVVKGWKFILGTTKYADNGVATLAMLISFSGENSMQSVCVLSNSDNYKKDIEDFIASVDVTRDCSTASNMKTETKNDAKSNSNNNKTNLPASFKNIQYEVWECNCPNLATNTQVMTKLNTVVLSPDGQYLTYMPESGLNGITPANSNQTGSWGSFTNSGNMLSFVNNKYGSKMELYKISSTAMSRYPKSTSSIYKKVKPVDGLLFEGAYSPELSYYNGKTDIISKQIDPNKRPIIFFKKDGTYINEGIAFSNLTLGDDYAIGRGTYEIVNYSLILTTQNGKKLQVAFTPVLDANPAAVDNGGFIVNNNLFYRLNKNFIAHN
ncbi:MAG: hypothetical protein QM726_08890 [Chitinophagaceae bacterium]